MVVMRGRQRDGEETTMGFKDAIGKALGEAAGKFAAEMQTLLVAEARGLAWMELKFEGVDYNPWPRMRR
jgi:hypothetical protein